MFEWLTTSSGWIALLTLTALEVVLGIDNIIFISILSGRLPEEQRPLARQVGLAMALGTRLLLLLSLSWIIGLTAPLFTLWEHTVSWRDVILIAGGLFLLAKSTLEIHHRLEGEQVEASKAGVVAASFASVVVQIAILDVVFSLDSVITAVGMVDELSIMIIAVVIAVIFMVVFINTVSDFVEKHPTFKILALSFLMLIGLSLVGEGLGLHIPKGYIYFSMGFSLFIEVISMQLRKKTRPVDLRGPLLPKPDASGSGD